MRMKRSMDPQDCTGAGMYAHLQNWNVALKINPTTQAARHGGVMGEGYSSAQSWCSAVILLGPTNS